MVQRINVGLTKLRRRLDFIFEPALKREDSNQSSSFTELNIMLSLAGQDDS